MIGQTVSHYKILRKIGEGGMGVVYKAQDLDLDRPVALKFLPSNLASFHQDKDRFLQEAKAAAALNHPNICTIYGIEGYEGGSSADNQTFIVMEHVEGENLREKMAAPKGTISSLPVKQVLEIGIQIADGLAAAHDKGIIHRDLKPENIMLQKDGRVKIMDFGLAKLKGTPRTTKVGTTAGTVGYMSPEQIQGGDTDHRTDIFSLGVLLYEALTGRSPFQGDNEPATLYRIVDVDAEPISATKPEIDLRVDAIVEECLEKDPSERYQSAAEVAKELKRLMRTSGGRVSMGDTFARRISNGTRKLLAKRSSWKLLSGILTAIMLALLVNRPAQNHDRSVMQFSIDLPPSSPIRFGSGVPALAISPDGKFLVCDTGPQGLFLRPMNQQTGRLLSGTEWGGGPFFSPDAQWIAFFSGGKLRKVPVFGGAAHDICSVPDYTRGGWWAPDNSILFGQMVEGIRRVSSNGGRSEIITLLDTSAGEISHRFPQLLPDGHTLLFTIKNRDLATFDDAVIAAERLDTHERKVLLRGATCARYVPTGHLVYARGKSLFAVPFDPQSLEVEGQPKHILDGGMLNQASGSASFSFSSNGLLAYVPGGPHPMATNTIDWVNRRGDIQPIVGPGPYSQMSLSSDGQKLALTIDGANIDIWIYHIPRKSFTRLTFGGGNNTLPLWTPDGKFVVYSAERGGASNLFWRRWDGSEPEQRLMGSSKNQAANSWTRDGKLLAFSQEGDIWIYPTEQDRKPWLFLQSSFHESDPAFSPDGRWMAYVSNETGQNEIYVVPFPKKGGRLKVSDRGGRRPMWAPSGHGLFYISGSNVMVVEVTLHPTFSASSPRKLFSGPMNPDPGLVELAPDGERFVIVHTDLWDQTTTHLEVVLGWFEELQQKFEER